jgi:alginate O-acetyltransferase complex protein AlgI
LLFESGLSGIVPQSVSEKKWLSPIKHIYALMVILLTFVIFRADTLSQGFGVIGAMFGTGAANTQVCAEIMSQMSALFVVALVFAVIFSTPIAPKIKATLSRYSALEYVGYLGTLCMFVLCILSLVSSEYNPFIYFRF